MSMLAGLQATEHGQAAAAAAATLPVMAAALHPKDHCAHISDVCASGVAQLVLSGSLLCPQIAPAVVPWVQAAAAAAQRRAADEVSCATRMGVDEDHAIVIEDSAQDLGRQDPAAGQADSDSEVVILDGDCQPAQQQPAAHAAQAQDQIAALSDKARGKAPAPPSWDTINANQARSEGQATNSGNCPPGAGRAALMPDSGLLGPSSRYMASASLAEHHTVHQEPLQSSACDCPYNDDVLDLTDD